MSAIEIVAAVSFWICVGAIAYTYVGYPGVIWACAGAFGRRRQTPSAEATALPRVSILIVAHNEEDSLEDRLTNALALDYPGDQFELVIASDGSTDRTPEVACALQTKLRGCSQSGHSDTNLGHSRAL